MRAYGWLIWLLACLLAWVGWLGWGMSQGLEGSALGDWFGGLTALFTVFAFLGLMRQVQLQGQELEATRQVLQDQKAELAAQVKAMDKQAEATARLHEQAEERTRQEHAIRVLAAYQEWQSAARKAWQTVTHCLVYTKSAADAEAEMHALYGKMPIKSADWLGRIDKLQGLREDWHRRAEEAIVSFEAAADAVDALDPDQLPTVNWQRIVENGLAKPVEFTKQAEAEFKKCADTFSMAALRLRKHLPTLGG